LTQYLKVCDILYSALLKAWRGCYHTSSHAGPRNR